MKENKKHFKKEKIMKRLGIIALSLVITLFASNLSVAAVSYSGQTLKVNETDISLADLLWQIKSQTSYSFIYSPDELKEYDHLNVNEEGSLNDILDSVFEDKDLEYKQNDNIYTINKIAAKKSEQKQSIIVKGKVIDSDKKPVPGVTVLVKGTTFGTATDVNGMYKLNIPNEVDNPRLIFSFIGLKTRVVEINKKRVIDVKLEASEEVLNEVVVHTGYQTIEKRRLTSAVTTLKGEDILLPGVMSVDQLLESKVPGMIMMRNSGQTGAAAKIRIRGTSTLLGSQEPLWVIDGIIQQTPIDIDPSQINDLDFVNLLGNAISGVNPEDIEQIDVLKDASATAIYGARASNGVIVITTKKGKVGPATISYSNSMTFTQRPRYSDKSMNMMNSKDRINLSRELIEKKIQYNSKINPDVGYEGALVRLYSGEINYGQFQEAVNRFESTNTDWFDVFTKDSFSKTHSLSISGGTNDTKYYASAGYSDQQGVLKGEMNKSYSTNINITGNINKFSYRFGINASKSEKKYAPKALNVLDYAYNTTRTLPSKRDDGSLWFYGRKSQSTEQFYDYNLQNEINNSSDEIDSHRLGLTFSLNYNFTDNLKLSNTFSYSSSNTDQDIYFGEKTFRIAEMRRSKYGVTAPDDSMCPFGGELKTTKNKQESYTARTQLNFNKYLDDNKDHYIGISVGGEISSNEYNSINKDYRAYVPERGKMVVGIDIDKYKKLASWRSNDKQALGVFRNNIRHTISSYATASYSYKSLYTFNINGRVDTSNKFGSASNDKILPIWSISSSWNIKDDVLSNTSWVNDLSLRGSFGLQGNMLDGQTPELIIKRGNRNVLFNSYESKINALPNPNLKWETTTSYNGTLNFALFNRKINGTVSYFYKKTTDAFLNKKIARINGQSEYVINSGTIENKGIEIGLNFNPVKRTKVGDFYWTIDPQFGQVINTLLSKATNNIEKNATDKRKVSYGDYLSGRVFIEGQPLNTFYSYKYKDLNPENGAPRFYNIEKHKKNQYLASTPNDVYAQVMEKSGTRVPFIQGGIMNSFGYKNFALTFNLAYSVGNKVRLMKLYSDASFANGTMAPRPQDNVRNEFNKRWKRPGDEKHTNMPAILSSAEFAATQNPWWQDGDMGNRTFAGNIWNMYDNSNLRVVSGNYIKIQSLSLRYMLSKEVCNKLKIKAAHVGFSGTDLYTFCDKALKGQSPMQSGSSDGINLSVRPTYSLSFNVNF